MRAVVQRVSEASVVVDGQVVGAIGRGLLVLLGVTHSDGEAEAAALARKIAGLRIFEDAAGKFNLALADVDGAVLVVSQFTLYGDARKGRRPSFSDAARPEQAEPLMRPLRGTATRRRPACTNRRLWRDDGRASGQRRAGDVVAGYGGAGAVNDE